MRRKRFATVEEAVEFNAARMTREQAERELAWLDAQEHQPPVRQALIRALRRRLSNTELSQP